MARPQDLRISFAGLAQDPGPWLSVDGMLPDGPNLSHWPGNRTPPEWKADLSTGICLRFAGADPGAQSAFLGEATTVVNDHYDTDGFLSILAVARPEVALPREELCLEAAATGDYQAFHTERGFAIDRIVLNLRKSDASPLADGWAGATADERCLAAYLWLVEHAERVLDAPESLSTLYADELATVRQELRLARQGALARRAHEAAELAVLHGERPFARIVLNTCAGAFRVLHAQDTERGALFRYHDRTESWFEVVSFRPPPRRDLRPLRDRLQELEERAGGSEGADAGARWCADPPTEPVPELYFGLPEPQEYGELTRTLLPGALAADTVEQEVARYLADPPPDP